MTNKLYKYQLHRNTNGTYEVGIQVAEVDSWVWLKVRGKTRMGAEAEAPLAIACLLKVVADRLTIDSGKLMYRAEMLRQELTRILGARCSGDANCKIPNCPNAERHKHA